MTTDLIAALQTHGQMHKGTDLGGVLQWAILHIQSQAEAIEELREEATGEMNERVRLEGLLHTVKGVIEAAMQAVETWENKPIDFSRDLAGHINLMACHGDSDYLKSNSQSIRHIDTRESRPRKRKQEQ